MSILVGEDTTFIIQGITGREAVNMTRECLDYGSRVVGGVTPGRGGRDVYGVPVYDTVREITSQQHVDGSVLTVPPAFVCDAAFEAIAAGIKLLAANDNAEVREGMQPFPRTVIVEFPDMEAARAWYESGDYQAIAPLRQAASTGTLFMIEGFSISDASSD